MPEAFTFGKADELRGHLEAHDPDTILFDGLTASAALELVVKAPKSFGAPVVVFDGREWAQAQANAAAQYELF